MKTTTTVAHWLIRGVGLLLIILGVIIWTGNADSIIPLHRFFGFVLVLALWTLAYVAARSGISPALVILAVVWGFVAPILGLTQEHLATGGDHWIIQGLHLLVGLVAIGLGDRLGTLIKTTAAPA